MQEGALSYLPQPHPVELEDASFSGSKSGRNRNRQVRRGKAGCREGTSQLGIVRKLAKLEKRENPCGAIRGKKTEYMQI